MSKQQVKWKEAFGLVGCQRGWQLSTHFPLVFQYPYRFGPRGKAHRRFTFTGSELAYYSKRCAKRAMERACA